MADCEKCGRPKPTCSHCVNHHAGHCNAGRALGGILECEEVATAYRRGLVAGVELVRDHYALEEYGDSSTGYEVDWTAVDAELARRIG